LRRLTFGDTRREGAGTTALAKRASVLSNLPVLNQQTFNRSASFSGIGLHSGNRVNMTILPAPANSGVRFRRVDLEGKPEIEARVENVGDTNRSTMLIKGNVKIQTVEHVLAALAGSGIDNAIVELDANEPPIADGSSRESCKIVQAASIAPQAEKRDPFTPTAPIELQTGETMMTLFPDEGFKILCTSAERHGQVRAVKEKEALINFVDEIARACEQHHLPNGPRADGFGLEKK
jgi:UDP-3-O-acyl-N-acetylglucosamine deacetylase